MKCRFAALTLLLLLGLLPTHAHADFKLCNRTSYILDAATASAADKDFLSQGWTRVAPGECEVAVKGDLKPITYYIYARSSLAHSGPPRAWGGTVPICIQESDFSLRSPPQNAPCPNDMAYRLPFSAVDPQGAKNWTVTLNESAAIRTMPDAQLAGVKRLLKDNGFTISVIDGKPGKQTQVALDAFRARMKFPRGATNDDLFNALETEALKFAAPTGFTVCNDGSGPIMAAMGEKTPKQFVSHGWWKIAATSCAKLTTAPLRPTGFISTRARTAKHWSAARRNSALPIWNST